MNLLRGISLLYVFAMGGRVINTIATLAVTVGTADTFSRRSTNDVRPRTDGIFGKAPIFRPDG